MTQTTVSPARAPARALAFVVPLLVAVGLGSACQETRRSLGDECIKDQDCLSNVCSQAHCAAAPPTIDNTPNNPDAGVDATVDAAGDAAGDSAAAEGAVDAAPETSPAETGSSDAPGDSPGDAAGG